MKIDKEIHLPSIKPNKIHLNSNLSNKFEKINTKPMSRNSCSNDVNNIVPNNKKTNSIEIYKPIRRRLRNALNNIDNLNGLNSLSSFNSFNSFNSLNGFDLHCNKNTNKYSYLYDSKNLWQKIDIPLPKNQFINSNKNKRKIVNRFNFKEKSQISKFCYYSNNNSVKNNKLIKVKSMKKIDQKDVLNMLKKLNILESKNYCFYSYSYKEYDNIPNRNYMEDFHCIKKNLLYNMENGIVFSYFAIFDGHGGKEVSSFLSQNFYNVLFNQLKNLDNVEDSLENLNKIASLIKNAFLLIDKEIIDDPSLKELVGSTATILFLFKLGTKDSFSKYLICANIGDSKGYIISNKKIYQITTDHNCRNEKEASRIVDRGGIVINNRVLGTLMLTRSFGDKNMKKHGVTCEPDFFCKKIKDHDKFVIIASDGLWDVISENDITEFVNTYENKILSSEEFSQKIVDLAIKKGTTDNVSCIVIKF